MVGLINSEHAAANYSSLVKRIPTSVEGKMVVMGTGIGSSLLAKPLRIACFCRVVFMRMIGFSAVIVV